MGGMCLRQPRVLWEFEGSVQYFSCPRDLLEPLFHLRAYSSLCSYHHLGPLWPSPSTVEHYCIMGHGVHDTGYSTVSDTPRKWHTPH